MESLTADPHLETTFLYMLAQLESSATGCGGSRGEAIGREGLWSFRGRERASPTKAKAFGHPLARHDFDRGAAGTLATFGEKEKRRLSV